jgi:hypothetical protein
MIETRPKRVRIRRGKPLPPGSVWVARPTCWGNPFKIDHTQRHFVTAHDESVRMFREWVMAPERAELREKARAELRGLDLACWCRPGLACHSDVWLEIANGPEGPGEGGHAR